MCERGHDEGMRCRCGSFLMNGDAIKVGEGRGRETKEEGSAREASGLSREVEEENGFEV